MADVKQDLEAIERLHQRDMQASRTGDFATLLSLMTDDAVVMPPGAHWIRDKAERESGMRNMEATMQQYEVLDYTLAFEEVKVLGDYAFEWGTIQGAMRPIDGVAEHYSYKVMRILQRPQDGEWKVHRTIWNENPKD